MLCYDRLAIIDAFKYAETHTTNPRLYLEAQTWLPKDWCAKSHELAEIFFWCTLAAVSFVESGHSYVLAYPIARLCYMMTTSIQEDEHLAYSYPVAHSLFRSIYTHDYLCVPCL